MGFGAVGEVYPLDPNHQGQCPQQGARQSLYWAMKQARDDLGPKPPGSYAAGWDINYTTAERLGMRRLHGAIERYNNQDSTDFADVWQVLTEVHERVRADLRRGSP